MSLKDNDLQSLNGSWYNSISRLIAIFNQSRSFVNDLQNVYRKSWKESMQSCTGKLRTYSKFKTDFTQENYLIQFPMHVRRNFTKLRISAHNLAIETGRYTNTKSICVIFIPAQESYLVDALVVSSVYHFMVQMTAF